MFYFDVDKFLTVYNKDKPIESIHIAQWIECSLRHVQKYAMKNDIPFKRNHGRKEYIWDQTSIRQFALWINRKYDKKLIQDEKKEKKNIIKKTKIKHISTHDVIRKHFVFPNDKGNEEYLLRKLERWANKNDVPFQMSGKRKFYHWTDEKIKACIPTIPFYSAKSHGFYRSIELIKNL